MCSQITPRYHSILNHHGNHKNIKEKTGGLYRIFRGFLAILITKSKYKFKNK